MKVNFSWLLKRLEVYSEKFKDGETKLISILIFILSNACFNLLFLFVFFVTNVPEMMFYNTFALILYSYSLYLILNKYKFVEGLFISIFIMCFYIPYTTFLFGYDIKSIILFFPIIFCIFFLFDVEKKQVLYFLILNAVALVFVSFILAFKYEKYSIGFAYLEYVNVIFSTLSIAFINYTLDFSKRLVNSIKHNEINTLENEANTDFLTGLYNKRYFEKEFDKEKYKDAFVIIADIDFFKRINDKYGHSVGDTVLKNIASIMKEFFEKDDLLIRWGGEEFLIIANELSESNMYRRIDCLRNIIKEADFFCNEEKFNVTITFGGKQIENEYSFKRNIKDADDCLYHGKKNGRDRVVFYNQIRKIIENI